MSRTTREDKMKRNELFVRESLMRNEKSMEVKRVYYRGPFLHQVAVDAVLFSRDECKELGHQNKQPATRHFVRNNSAMLVTRVYIEYLRWILAEEQIVVFLPKTTTKTTTRPGRWVVPLAPIPS